LWSGTSNNLILGKRRWASIYVNAPKIKASNTRHLRRLGIVKLLGRTVPVIGKRLEAAITSAARVAADGQQKRVDHLHQVVDLATPWGQALLDEFLDLTETNLLSREPAAIAQVQGKGLIMGVEIGDDVLVRASFEVLAVDLNGNHLLVGQSGSKPPRRIRWCAATVW